MLSSLKLMCINECHKILSHSIISTETRDLHTSGRANEELVIAIKKLSIPLVTNHKVPIDIYTYKVFMHRGINDK